MDAIRTSEKLIDAKNDLVYIITELRKENSILNKKLSENEEETIRAINNYCKDIKLKDERIQDLEKDYNLHKKKSIEQSEFLTNDFNQKILEYRIELENAQKRCERHEKLERLTIKENQELEQLRNSNHEANTKIKLLETKIQDIQQKYERDSKQITRDNLISKAKLMKAMEKEVTDIRKKALEEARDDFEGGVIHMIENNKKITFELKDKIHVLEELQRDKNHIELILSKTKQNLKLSKDKEIEYANQMHWQSKEHKILKREVKKLQEEIDKFKQQVEEEKVGTVLLKHKNTNDSANDDVKHLKSMVHKKNLELARIKSMAKQLLHQRSECEIFLCDSIAFVKKMIINEKKRKKTSTSDNKLYNSHKNEKYVEPKQKIELSELSWKDRERVFRLLFEKIDINELKCA